LPGGPDLPRMPLVTAVDEARFAFESR